MTASAGAQNDPSNFATVINVPPDSAPSSIGSSTQLNLGDGGVIGTVFQAGNPDGTSSNVEVNISGGIVVDDFIATGSVVNVSGGTLADFFPRNGSVFNISGGTLGESFSVAEAGSEVNISGGEIDTHFRAFAGSVVNFSGGRFYGGDFGIRARSGAVFNISGGTIGREFNGEGGSSVTFRGGTVGVDFDVRGDTEIIGGEFQLNGADFLGTSISLASGDVFTGTLEDGTPFVFSPLVADVLENVQLTSTPLPPRTNTPLIIPGAIGPSPAGLRAGESLTLQSGGALGDNFGVVGAVLNVEGGVVGRGVEVIGGTINVSGGEIGGSIPFGNNFNAYDGSDVNVSGGKINGAVHAFNGSDVEITGGDLSHLIAESNSAVLVAGGRIAEDLRANSGSSVAVTGGTIGGIDRSLIAAAGSTAELSGGRYGNRFHAASGSVDLVGGEFRLNGVDYMPNSISLQAGDLFTGTLADGSVFVFSTAVGDSLTDVSLTRVPLPVAGTSPIVVEAASATLPNGLRPGQSLIIRNGGSLGDNLAAVDASIQLQDGSIGQGLEVFDTQVDVDGGTIGDRFAAYSGAVVDVTAGTIGRTSAYSGSEFNVSGGQFENGLGASSGAVINITGGVFDNGGQFGGSIDAGSGSVVNIKGGSFGNDFDALTGSTVNLFGSEFFINDTPIDSLMPGESLTILERSFFAGSQAVVLSGRLDDGSSFSFALNARCDCQGSFFSAGATLTVTLSAVPEPSSLLLAFIGAILTFVRFRS